MSADVNELLARAQSVCAEQLPTREELAAQLESVLDGLERDFPDGEPPHEAGFENSMQRTAYWTQMIEINSLSFALEDAGEGVSWVRARPPSLNVIAAGRE